MSRSTACIKRGAAFTLLCALMEYERSAMSQSTPPQALPPQAASRPEIDLEVMALLCTRLCHDLSGPIGAIAAGTELLGDGDDEFIQETAALLAHSSNGAVARLKFLRAALGVAQGDSSQNAPKALLGGYIEAVYGTDVTLEWLIEDGHVWSQAATCRLALNMSLVALESLGGRGTLSLGISPDQRLVVRACGKRCRIAEATALALAGERTALSPRTAQAYYLACLVGEKGSLVLNAEDGWLELSSRLPSLEK